MGKLGEKLAAAFDLVMVLAMCGWAVWAADTFLAGTAKAVGVAG